MGLAQPHGGRGGGSSRARWWGKAGTGATAVPMPRWRPCERPGTAARGADLYVTLEPCNHHGNTPPCTEAILAAGVHRVMTPPRTPTAGSAAGARSLLREKGIQVEMGLLAAEVRRLNEAWFTWMETGRPFVIAKAACSLDGKIATAHRRFPVAHR